jgi:hypothetical protein
MKRFLVAAALALVPALPALAAAAETAVKKQPSPPAARGKPQAPVTVSARLVSGRATVSVAFHSAASDVSVEVHGVDGLAVTTDATPLSGGRFARGEAVTLDVGYTDGATPGQLAVVVTGRFGGGVRVTTAAFRARPATPEQLKPSGAASTDSTGRRIKVLPVEPR